MKKILLVEDDALLNKTLTYNLISEGYDTVSALNAGTATQLLTQTEYDLVLLDINLPDGSGYDLCRLIKPENPDTLVIFLTANDQESDQIRGYEVGAVDYITKPFDIDEVMLRIQAVLRRTEAQTSALLIFRDLKLDTDSKRVYVKGNEITCTAMEYAILELMLKNPKTIFSKRRLYESVSGDTYLSDDNTMNVHISNLRKKIAKFTSEEYIETVYGMGYRLVN